MALARVLKQGPDELILAVRGFAEALEATNTAVDAEVERGQRERERERASECRGLISPAKEAHMKLHVFAQESSTESDALWGPSARCEAPATPFHKHSAPL